MKKIISLIIATVVILGAFGMIASAAVDKYFMLAQVDNKTLFVNGGSVDFDPVNPAVVPAMDEEGTVFVPVRMVVGAAGGWVGWVAEENKVELLYNGVSISFVVGSTEITVGEEKVELAKAPYIENDRTLVPLGFFEECMKGSASFDMDTNTAMIAFETTVYAAG